MPTVVIDVEAAVRRVAPALNIDPASIKRLPGVIKRARRRPEPTVVALGGVTTVLVFLPGSDRSLELVAGQRGLAALSEQVSAVCRELIVAWEYPAGGGAAAAFAVHAGGECGPPLGTSWQAPETWPTPMIDASRPAGERIDDALAAVRAVVADNSDAPDADGRLTRALDVLDKAMLAVGADSQNRANARAAVGRGASDVWLQDLERSILDERRRVARDRRTPQVEVAAPVATGPLSGLRVFVSYARPDGATLAWPVNRALQSAGAQVWFDQQVPLEDAWLDEGLAAQIAECDGFVACVRSEYFERAGYATPELAWALTQNGAGGRLRRLAILVPPEGLVPSRLSKFPVVSIGTADDATLGAMLAHALTASEGLGSAAVARSAATLPPELPAVADLDASRRRRRHLQRFLELTLEDAVALAQGKDNQRAVEARRRFRMIGDGLEWDGTLGGVENWPNDSLVRACRWDLGCLRVLAALRWPLSGKLSEPDGIAADLELILNRQTPIFGLPPSCGWDDNERRLSLRRHAGLLRVLQQMLAQGLDGSLTAESVDEATIRAWEAAAADRRRDVYDALIEMRVREALSWRGEPPVWDRLLGAFTGWLTALPRAGLPPEVLLCLASNADDIATIAADVVWTASRRLQPTGQSFEVGNWLRPVAVLIWTAPESLATRHPAAISGSHVDIGIVSSGKITVTWRDLAGVRDGTTDVEVPEELRQRLAFAIA